jgi:cytochrome c551/c552
MKLKFLLIAAFLSVSGPVAAFEGPTAEDMPFVQSSESCRECHTPDQVSVFQGNTTKSCSVFCTTCHLDLGAHHEVNLFLPEKPRATIKLLNNKIACFTCHDLTKKRTDKASWKAESLFERMFQSKPVYPTYFLIMKNNEGQLCKQCH